MRNRPTLVAWRAGVGTESIFFGRNQGTRQIPTPDTSVPDFIHPAVTYRHNDALRHAQDGFEIRDLRPIGNHITANSALKAAILAACTCGGEGDIMYDNARRRLIALAEQTLPEGQIHTGRTFRDYADAIWRGTELTEPGHKIARLAATLFYGLNKGIAGKDAVHIRGQGSGHREELGAILSIDEIRKNIRGEARSDTDDTSRTYNFDGAFIGSVAGAMETLLDYRENDGKYKFLGAVCIKHLTITSVAAGLDSLPADQRGVIANRFIETFLREQTWHEVDELDDETKRAAFTRRIIDAYQQKMQAIEREFGQTQGYGNHHMAPLVAAHAIPAAAAAGATLAPVTTNVSAHPSVAAPSEAAADTATLSGSAPMAAGGPSAPAQLADSQIPAVSGAPSAQLTGTSAAERVEKSTIERPDRKEEAKRARTSGETAAGRRVSPPSSPEPAAPPTPAPFPTGVTQVTSGQEMKKPEGVTTFAAEARHREAQASQQGSQLGGKP